MPCAKKLTNNRKFAFVIAQFFTRKLIKNKSIR